MAKARAGSTGGGKRSTQGMWSDAIRSTNAIAKQLKRSGGTAGAIGKQLAKRAADVRGSEGPKRSVKGPVTGKGPGGRGVAANKKKGR